MLQIGRQYTRDQVQDIVGARASKGGDWATGYTAFNGAIYAFCNVGTAGRTGHDYANSWNGDRLIWQGKSGSARGQPLVDAMIAGDMPIHMFFRAADRSPFTYAGLGNVESVISDKPVTIEWSFAGGKPAAPLTADQLAAILSQLGFTLHDAQVKSQLATRGPINIYLKRDSRASPLVIDPKSQDQLTRILSSAGIWRTKGDFYYHQSTLLKFPSRRHGGKTDTHYGLDFELSSDEAVAELVGVLDSSEDKLNTPNVGDLAAIDPRTETESRRAARLGQTRFRNDLLHKWSGRCALTGLEMPELIRASHIKPWAKATNFERLDPHNGLPLLVHLDLLFDRGLISFTDNGEIMFSPRVTSDHHQIFGLSPQMRVAGLTDEARVYMAHHRDFEFKAD